MTYVVDAMSVVYAGYFSAGGPKTPGNACSESDYKRSIFHFLLHCKPQNTYVCWEGPKSTAYRKNLNKDYKSNREWDPGVLEAIKAMKILCEENAYREISVSGFEADDTIVALCKYLKSSGEKIEIISRDRDLLQAVQKGYADCQYDPVQKVYLESPDYNIVKYKALVGDMSDCIKGVTQIGKKKALKVLAGEIKLTEAQEAEYQAALKLIDTEAHPQFEALYEVIKGGVGLGDRILKLGLDNQNS